MSDPLTFNPLHIRFSERGPTRILRIKGRYRLPCGKVFVAIGPDRASVRAFLLARFNEWVACLSAHERLAWIAASREGA